MPELQVDDVQRQLARAFDIAGGFTTSVASSVSPVIIVGPGAAPPYDSQLRYARADQISGDATHPGLAGLINPSQSAAWFVVDQLLVSAQAAVQNFQFNIYYGQNVGASLVEAAFPPNVPWVDVDTRQRAYGGSPLVAANFLFENGASTIAGMSSSIVLGTVHGGQADQWTPAAIATPLVLVPNTGLFWGSLTNTSNWWFQLTGRVFPVRQK